MKGIELPLAGNPCTPENAGSSPAIRTNFPQQIANPDDLRTDFAQNPPELETRKMRSPRTSSSVICGRRRCLAGTLPIKTV